MTTALPAPGGGAAESLSEPAGTTEPTVPAEPDATQAFPAADPSTEALEPEATASPDATVAPPAAEGHPTEAHAAPVPEPAGTAEPPVPTELDATRIYPATGSIDGPAPDRPNGPPFLTARGLTARGHQGPIFTGVDLVTGLGQLVAVCGDSGDGRTSLLLALCGRFAFQSGALRVDGQTRPGQIRRRFTVAQAGPPIRFDEYHTVASCIKETTAVSKGTATRANIHAWLDRLAVDVDTGDTFGFLPRIDQITFAIACAAASRTPAIVVDDADTGLDRCGSERVFEALRTVADAGQLVLAACTRSDPPADAVVDLRGQDRRPGGRRARFDHRNGDEAGATRRHRREDARNGGHQ
ncbi:hypothetical protein [Glycomyces sp. NRRL B-16210]|uniref:hypothetical protein n=1 Tax=Glycomyces sp. NRRL B-16210 TaxID=1463821 RepID=UPI0005588605|nr:hypothetical protein [Glycomyces sp. NRRL B-16210]